MTGPDAAGAAGRPHLVAAAVAARGVSLELELREGVTTAVVGANGAGKSTLLGLLSGLVRPSSGTVALAGRTVAGLGAWTPPHRRDVALLTQRPLLFPHLDVTANVAFGVAARGATRAASVARARAELDAVGAAALGRRRPGELSGGQAQRVALARALATDPAVLLLDEPLAALDLHAAAELRALLAERLRGRTAVLVTHDALDLWTLAHDLVVLADGRVVAAGPRDAVLGRPPTPFVADLAGTNRLVGVADADGVRLPDGTRVAGVPDADAPPRPDGPALALFEPAAVALHADAPGGSPRNAWATTVLAVEPRGPLVRVRMALPDGQELAADVTPRAAAEVGVTPGAPVVAAVKAAQVRCVRGG